ncbi:hypothetical protein [Actinomyces glycerinitolerans]|uniref:Uncharacterized protein n=1 Tax=Actinomyces glycerinitolerans TaxID=1892869 RepID=A0A1M4S0T4_9ACTO|nr:hypothetical protein [Actinomyces glycerinitolerans]SHE25577.1 Hypothetical protein ACGLYG10_1798 [Actinomyces glycerinitolerans]
MSGTDVIAVAALLVSIVSAVFSQRLYTREVKSQGYQMAMTMFHELDRVFIDHPYARPYFYNGERWEEEKSGDRYFRLESIAEMYLDVSEVVLDTKLGLMADDEPSWRAFIVDCLAASPITVEHLTSAPEWHPRTYKLWRQELSSDTNPRDGIIEE